jgi:protein-ribulosamine 3-kinase
MAIDSLGKILEESLTRTTGKRFRISDRKGLGGGCINSAELLTGEDGRQYFIKHNNVSFVPVFEAESVALRAIAETGAIRVPAPVGICQSGQTSALILEYLNLNSSNGDWGQMGRALARLHRSTGKSFGWPGDNWIGSTPQINTRVDSWLEFYSNCRLEPQIRWARKKSLSLSAAEALLEALPSFFTNYSPSPSLLHGDLWGGNANFLEGGSPVVFDPASYFGDREADLAMTELFGGFPGEFYAAYEHEWPLDPGYRDRRDLYNLYHILNHFNIFGGGYGAQADSLIRSLLSKSCK